MVVRQPSKLVTWVRFPSPAPNPRFRTFCAKRSLPRGACRTACTQEAEWADTGASARARFLRVPLRLWCGWVRILWRTAAVWRFFGPVRLVQPPAFGGPVVPVDPGSLRSDLEVLAVLLVRRRAPGGEHVLPQLVPVEVEGERVEQKRLRDQAMKREDADLLEHVREQHVVIRFELLGQQAREGGRHGLAVQDRHDPEKGRHMLGARPTEVRSGRPALCGIVHGPYR